MKRLITTITVLAFTLLLFSRCSDWTEPEAENYFKMPSPSYYEDLKAYKKSDHIVTFGWFGNWTGKGASLMNSMMGLPDSVDFVSIWGNWFNLNPVQLADKQKVKELKGTKAKICFIVKDLGDQTTPAEVRQNWQANGYASSEAAVEAFWGWKDGDEEAIQAAIEKYAKSISDSAYKYDYDGFDWDLEYSYDTGGTKFWRVQKRRDQFIEALSKYFGPLSGTGRMLGVDGQPEGVDKKYYHAIDWFILQAYNSSGYSDLDTRANRISNHYAQEGVTRQEILKKIIFCENFESYAATGGRASHSLRGGGTTNSLKGMALWRSTDGYRAGGIGTFHMEYDYPNVPEYRYLRDAVTAANPPVL